MVYLQGYSPSYSYTITFSQPVLNPVLHVANLAGTLTFEGANPVKVSGTVGVSGNAVIGEYRLIDHPWEDDNGTIMFVGLFSTLRFTADYQPGVFDGIWMQVGGVPVHTLTVTKTNGGWGEVGMNPEPNDANQPTFVSGTAVTLTATPISGKSFKQWEIYDPNYPGDANYITVDANLSTTLAMNTDMQVNAVFKCGSSVGPMLPLMTLALGGLALLRRRR
jgi:MYXO-CTERM domain-containing protein